MKLKYLLAVLCFSFSYAFAANVHQHPHAASLGSQKNMSSKAADADYCEIEIINNTLDEVYVFATYEDGYSFDFDIYPYEAPHYLDLDYDGYCHSGMYITIETPYYGVIYSQWTLGGSTIDLYYFAKNNIKAKLSAK